jgi:hypothetical protein
LSFFPKFFESLSKSDKKTIKDNMTPYFANAETAGEFVTDPYSKFEEKADKWGETLHQFFDDGKFEVKALARASDSTILPIERVVGD